MVIIAQALRLKCELKAGAEAWLGLKGNGTTELLYYHFANGKSKAYAIHVDLLGRLFEAAEQLEELSLTLSFDSDSIVFYGEPEVLVFIV